MWDSESDDFYSTSPSYEDEKFKCLYDLTNYLAAVVGVTCSLSIIGSFLIILSFILIPTSRTKARGILVNLSFMDLLVGLANLVGISMQFNKHLGHEYYRNRSHVNDNSTGVMYESLCIAQASIAMYATWSSILWTNCIAVYIYFRVVTDDSLSRKILYSLYFVAYGLPVILVVWQVCSKRFGFDRHAGSSWCSSVVTKDGQRLPFNAVFVNDIWIYLTIFLVTILLVALHFHFKLEVKGRSVLTQNTNVMVSRVEKKLLFIPVFFILLRIWSFSYVVLSLEAGVHFKCSVSAFFIFASGIGDSGQGFTNAILFVFATPKVRNYFLRILTCHTSPKQLVNGRESDSSWRHGRKSDYSSFASSEKKEYSGELNDSMDKVPRSLLLNN